MLCGELGSQVRPGPVQQERLRREVIEDVGLRERVHAVPLQPARVEGTPEQSANEADLVCLVPSEGLIRGELGLRAVAGCDLARDREEPLERRRVGVVDPGDDAVIGEVLKEAGISGVEQQAMST